MSLSVIETIFAFVMGGIILLIINYFLEGSRLKITHSDRQLERENPLTYRHVFSIQNKGKTAGRVLDIIVEPNEVKQSLIFDLDNNKTMVARFNVDGKQIRNIAIDCFPPSTDIRYRLTVIHEKSFLRISYEKPKIIWPN